MKRHYLVVYVLLFFVLLVLLFGLSPTAQTVEGSNSVSLTENYLINKTSLPDTFKETEQNVTG